MTDYDNVEAQAAVASFFSQADADDMEAANETENESLHTDNNFDNNIEEQENNNNNDNNNKNEEPEPEPEPENILPTEPSPNKKIHSIPENEIPSKQSIKSEKSRSSFKGDTPEAKNEDNNNNNYKYKKNNNRLSAASQRNVNNTGYNRPSSKSIDNYGNNNNIGYNGQIESYHQARLQSKKNLSFDLMNHPLMAELQVDMTDLRNAKDELENENEELKLRMETITIKMESQIDSLELQLKQAQSESQEYKEHYNSIMDEMKELKQSNNAIENVEKERNEIITALQTAKKRETELVISYEKLSAENDQLKNQNKKLLEQSTKLNKAMITIKQQKNTLQNQLSKVSRELEIHESNAEMQLEDLENRLEEQIILNEKLEKEMIEARKANMNLQNEMIESTFELLHDDINENDGRNKQESKAFRLRRVGSKDLSNNMHNKNDSKMSQDLNVADINDDIEVVDDGNNNFIGSRYDSMQNIPQESLNDLAKQHMRNYSIDSMASRRSVIDQQVQPGISQEQMLTFKKELHDGLIKDIKVIIQQELNDNIDIEKQLKDVMPELLKNNENDNMNEDERKMENEELINNVLNESKKMIIDNLQDKLNEIMKAQSNSKEIENTITKGLENIYEKLNSNDDIKNTVSKSIEQSMTAMQLALENTIDETFVSVIERSISKQMKDNSLKDGIIDEFKNELGKVSELIKESQQNKKVINENEDDVKEMGNGKKQEIFLDEMKTKIEELMDQSMQQTMKGRIDGFMEEFRKEVIPEFQGIIQESMKNETILKSRNSRNSIGDNINMDDEKYDESSKDLLTKIDKLNNDINELNKDNELLKEQVKDAATSKVKALNRMQNLVDHLRDENKELKSKIDGILYNIKKNKYNKNTVNFGNAFGWISNPFNNNSSSSSSGLSV